MLTEKQKQATAIAKKKKGVIKINSDFARNCRYGLTLQEHRIVYFAVLKSEIEKRPYEPVTFSVKEFASVCGIVETGVYTSLRQLTKKLLSRVVEYVFMNESGDTILQQAQWLSGVQYHVNSGTVTIAINPYIEPLFRKYKQYTETEFAFLCKFSCQYSERLYELLKSLAWDKKPTVDFSTEDLRERLGMKMVRGEKEVNKYPNYNDFERFVIIPSKEDINKYTDLDIDYRVHRGLYNKVDKVIFSVRKKDNYVPLAERIANGEFDTLPELEGQITLFDDDEFDCEEE